MNIFITFKSWAEQKYFMDDLLKKLIKTHGISGYEDDIRELIASEISKYVDDVTVGKMGSLIARKKGKGPKIMLAAHMDEVGLMIKYIDHNGRIRFSPIGSLDAMTIVGQRVNIIARKKKNIFGVVTLNGISEGASISELPKIKDMYVDTGLTRDELRKNGVSIGAIMALEQESGFLGKEEVIFGKALDDRLGCYILIELAKKVSRENLHADVYFVFTVEEEIGLSGAIATAYKVEPDYAIAVDITNIEHESKAIGKGTCIGFKDSSMIGNKTINDHLIKLAHKKAIPLQYDVSDDTSSDALGISMTKGGIPSTVVGPAIKNIHSTIGVANMKDVENTIFLLHELLLNPNVKFG